MKFARKATGGGVPFSRSQKLALNTAYSKRPGLAAADVLAKIERTNNYGLPVTRIHHERPCTGKHCQECRGTQK